MSEVKEHPGHTAAGHVSHAAMAAVTPALNRDVETKFFFKKPKAKETPEGVEIVDKKRDTVVLMLPIPTFAGLIHSLGNDENPELAAKVQNYVLTLIETDIAAAARQQVDDEVKPVNKQEELDLSKLTLEYLATEPAADRRGRGIAKEVWEAFVADYISIMPALLDKPIEKVQAAAGVFAKKLMPAKGSKQVLEILKTYLDMWFEKTANAENFGEVYEFLSKRADAFLAVDEQALLEGL